jgi:hypothetical protein
MRYFLQIFFLTIPFLLKPQLLNEKQIFPFDGQENDFFGRSIAVSDSFLFVGSLRYSDPPENSVYVYRYTNNGYEFEYKLFPSFTQTGLIGQLFGSRLIYNDGKLFVGAQNRKIHSFYAVGAVYYFAYENHKWVEKQTILPPEPHTPQGLFSNAIAVWKDYLLIGASRFYSEDSVETGKVFLYKQNSGLYELEKEFFPFDGKEGQGFGNTVLINENLMVIGSSSDSTESGKYSGSIYVYAKEDSLWKFSRKYFPEPNSENLAYGCVVGSNNDYVFVGTTNNTFYYNPGKVYIYKISGNELDLVQIIESGDNYYDDRFGISLFAKGDSLLVSAIFDTVKNDNPGSVYLFVNEKGDWNKKHKISPSDEVNTRWFGGRCILTNNEIFIGAHQTKVNDIRPGAVYFYSDKPLSANNDEISTIHGFYLFQNYPNPFNPETKIKYTIPTSPQTPLLTKERGRGEVVTLKVYDILGKEIAVLVNKEKPPGEYEVKFNAENLSSGIYFYTLTAGNFREIKKMIFLR